MIIDVRTLRQKGLDEKSFSFEYLPKNELLSLPDASFVRPAKIEALCEVYPDKAYVSGSIEFSVQTVCSRCLEPTVFEGFVEFDEEFLPKARATEKETSYEKDRIDLTPLVEQLILTNLPYSVYCKEDCKGLCPVCFKNLNDGECGCID